MAMLPQAANTAGNNETMGDRTPLEAGDYLMHVNKSEFKATKAKTGHYLAVQLVVIEGPKKGRIVFVNLNLDNPNPVAVEIANKELNSICAACGLVGATDSEQFHNIPMLVSLTVKPATAQFAASNEVSGYKSAGNAVNPADKVPDFAQQQAANPAGNATATNTATPPVEESAPAEQPVQDTAPAPSENPAPTEEAAGKPKLPWE